MCSKVETQIPLIAQGVGEHLLVVVVVEERIWLPWEPGLHLDARVVNDAEVVGIEQDGYKRDGVDGVQKRGNEYKDFK